MCHFNGAEEIAEEKMSADESSYKSCRHYDLPRPHRVTREYHNYERHTREDKHGHRTELFGREAENAGAYYSGRQRKYRRNAVRYRLADNVRDKAAADKLLVRLECQQETRYAYAERVYERHLYRLEKERYLYYHEQHRKQQAVRCL